jgi:guanine deaminase
VTVAVVGTVLQAPSADRLEVLRDVVVSVDGTGTITSVHPAVSPAGEAAVAVADEVHRLSSWQRLLPGLVDLHIHAPQWPQLGTGLDLPLEQWLFEHTFPLESRYADLGFARDVWAHMVPSLLAHGTTTAVYFSSVHETATLALAEQCMRSGQRAYVGRVAMDHDVPDYYCDASAAEGVAASRRSVDDIRALGSALVQPIITPRFVPACSDALLRGLGALADETGALVQTHCSESVWEHGAVLERYGHSDTVALQTMGLLRAGTVLAHGNHLGDDDLPLIRAAGAGVAHCPLSNTYFANGTFPTRRVLDAGVKVGMGTDIAGGAEPGLLHQCALAVDVSRSAEPIDAVTAFHLGTVGGADVLGAPVGLLAVGRQFDAIVVDVDGPVLRSWDGIDDEARVFEKIVRLARPTDISQVWVAGRPRA